MNHQTRQEHQQRIREQKRQRVLDDRERSTADFVEMCDALSVSDEQIAAVHSGIGCDPNASLLGFLLGAASPDNIAQEIALNVEADCIAEWKTAINPATDLVACSACGMREFGNAAQCKFSLETNLLLPLRYTEAEQEDFDLQPEVWRLAKSSYATAHHRYHVHQELVTDNMEVHLCESCVTALRQGKRPALSVACVDYGNYRRLELPELSLVEKLLLAQFRVYGVVLKCRAQGRGTHQGRSHLTGHMIAIPHEGPAVAVTALEDAITSVRQAVTVVFLGNRQLLHKAFEAGRLGKYLQADPVVLLKWLAALRELRTDYCTHFGPAIDAVLDALVSSGGCADRTRAVLQASDTDVRTAAQLHLRPEDLTALAELPSRIVQGAEVSEENSPAGTGNADGNADGGDTVTDDSDMVTDDVAGVRRPAEDHEPVTEEVVMESVCIAPREHVPAPGTVLQSVAEALRAPRRDQVYGVRTQGDAANEFDNNRALLAGAFPWVFLLGGRSAFSREGSVPVKASRHLFLQFTGIASSESQLIFLLANQRMRHAACQVTAARVNSNPEALRRFEQLVNSEQFQQQLQQAEREGPASALNQSLTKQLLHHVELPASLIPNGPVARRMAAKKLYAMLHYLGLPTLYWTISPDDVHCSMAVRMSVPSSANAGFPFEAQPWLQAFAAGESFCIPGSRTEVSSSAALYELAAKNPIAACEAFYKIADGVMTSLLGTPHEASQKKSHIRVRGLFGTARGTFLVVEVQGRDSLHLHLLYWCGITPELMQKHLHEEDFRTALITKFNEAFQAQLPRSVHLQSLVNRAARATGSAAPTAPVREARKPVPPVPGSAEWNLRVAQGAVQSCVHAHSPTCRKGQSGQIGCRLGMPAALCDDSTCIVQLKSRPADTPMYEVLPGISLPPKNTTSQRSFSRYPLPAVDRRMIVIELPRPMLSAREPEDEQLLQDLPEASRRWVERNLPVQNGLVSPFNPTTMALLPGNQAAYPLGSAAQAKGALFYLLDYITKDSHPLSNSLTALTMARQHIEQYPSRAADTGSADRTALHLLQRLLNTITGMMELSATQAAALVLGHPAEMSSHGFCTVFVSAAEKFLRETCHVHTELDDEESEFAVTSDSDDDEDEAVTTSEQQWQEAEKTQPGSAREALDAAARQWDGGAVIYHVDERKVPVPQHVHYAYRGAALQRYNLYEYSALVKIVPVPRSGQVQPPAPSPPAQQQQGVSDTTAGRPANGCYEFEDGHPLKGYYQQRLRSKLLIPQPVATSPSMPTSVVTVEGRKQARKAAAYFLTLFKPWSIRTVPTFSLSWRSFVDFTRGLELGSGTKGNPQPTVVGRIRLRLMSQMVSTRKISSNADVAAFSSYRHRNRTLWNARRTQPDGTEPPPGACTQDQSPDDPESQMEVVSADLAIQRAADATREALGILAAQSFDAATTHQDELKQSKYVADMLRAHDSLLRGSIRSDSGLVPETVSAVVLRPENSGKSVDAVLKALETERPEQPPPPPPPPPPLPPLSPATDETVIPFPSMESLNDDQRRAATVLLEYLRQGVTVQVPSTRDASSSRAAPRLLIHGGPGCGKTYFVKYVMECARVAGIRVICGAFSAAAACNLPGGDTLHSIAGFSVRDRRLARTPMSVATLERLRQRHNDLRPAQLLIIDEISMVDVAFLGALSHRFQQIMNSTEDFGGLAVIVLGDFFQIPPVNGTSLAQATVTPLPDTKSEDSYYSYGRTLFRSFQRFEFNMQERAKEDGAWCQFIDTIRTDRALKQASVRHIRSLTISDVQQDRSWLFAPVAVTNNEERAAFNWRQAQLFAATHGAVVVAWLKPLLREHFTSGSLSDTERSQLLRTDVRLREFFVSGAPCYLSENMSPAATHKGVCNGAAATMHSLCFEDPEYAAWVEQKVTQHLNMPVEHSDELGCEVRPVLWLDRQPQSLNVTLTTDASAPVNRVLLPPETLVDMQNVIPLKPTRDADFISVMVPRTQSTAADGTGGVLSIIKGRVSVRHIPVDPGFAITFHKLQGKTLDRLLVDLNKPPKGPNPTFEFVYVALTRVRRGNHVRALPPPPGQSLEHLHSLAANEHTSSWLLCFDGNGFWDNSRVPAPLPAKKGKKAHKARPQAAPKQPAAPAAAAPAQGPPAPSTSHAPVTVPVTLPQLTSSAQFLLQGAMPTVVHHLYPNVSNSCHIASGLFAPFLAVLSNSAVAAQQWDQHCAVLSPTAPTVSNLLRNLHRVLRVNDFHNVQSPAEIMTNEWQRVVDGAMYSSLPRVGSFWRMELWWLNVRQDFTSGGNASWFGRNTEFRSCTEPSCRTHSALPRRHDTEVFVVPDPETWGLLDTTAATPLSTFRRYVSCIVHVHV